MGLLFENTERDGRRKETNCCQSAAGQHIFQQLKPAWMLRDCLWETIYQTDVAIISIRLRLQQSTFAILKTLLPFLLLIVISDKYFFFPLELI